MTPFDVVIVGAGPAGSALAVRLAAAGRSVLLCDRKPFPRDKLCGEFLSPEAKIYLHDLGMEERLRRAVRDLRVPEIRSVHLSIGRERSLTRSLPSPGLGLSRRVLDQLLVEEARERGALWLAPCVVRSVHAREGRGSREEDEPRRGREKVFVVNAVAEEGRREFQARAVVNAGGHRSGLADGKPGTGESKRGEGARGLVSFKRHWREAASGDRRAGTGRDQADPAECVEVFPFPGGYCGISPVEGGRRNVCLIGRVSDLRRCGGTGETMLRFAATRNPALSERLSRLGTPETEKFLGDSGFRISPRSRPQGRGTCLPVGDAAGRIAPLCGDGISMALRSARIAAERLEWYLEGRSSWEEALRSYARAWSREFGARIRLGYALHLALTRPGPCRLLLGAGRAWPPLVDSLIVRTRDGNALTASPPTAP